MIADRNGQIRTKTGRDHGRRPECLNIKLRHNGWWDILNSVWLRPVTGRSHTLLLWLELYG
jgi:hypothetical protein